MIPGPLKQESARCNGRHEEKCLFKPVFLGFHPIILRHKFESLGVFLQGKECFPIQ
ncbi:hypothetical protein HAX54_028183, partial [Datura stramonium]|nr:hypothetical protein [Datura stramonium]